MPRGAPIYARIDCDIWDGERVRQLSVGEQLTYIYLWTLAVKCRSATIPPELASVSAISDGMHRRWQSVQSWLAGLTANYETDYASDYETDYESGDGSVEPKSTKAYSKPLRKRRYHPLVSIHPDGSITVHKVKDLHPRLLWDKDYKLHPIRGNENP